jgi:tetratricopeptide (TPR) repeat protein
MDEELLKSLKRINAKLKLFTLLTQAKIEFDKNNYPQCAEKCKSALEINPNNPVALRGLGCVAQLAGEVETAIEFYKQAAEFSDHKEIEYTLLGTVCYNNHNLEDAIKYYNMAIDSNDNYESAYEGRNQAMLENHLELIDFQDKLERIWNK